MNYKNRRPSQVDTRQASETDRGRTPSQTDRRANVSSRDRATLGLLHAILG